MFDFFKNKKQTKQGNVIKDFDKDLYEKVANQNYPGIGLYARDTFLSEKLCEKYNPGVIICERGFTDASNRFMGMATSHRYVILSNHMANISMFEHGTNWGLCVAQHGSHFKVLGKHTHSGKTGIFLLHLPDGEDWKIYLSAEFSIDQQIYQMAVQRFVAKCDLMPVPELTTKEWLMRCVNPLGMNEQGELFDL